MAAADDAAGSTNRSPNDPPSAACCGVVTGAARLIIIESTLAEATKAAPRPATRASDLRDAAIWISEAVCYTTIPSVDTARFSPGVARGDFDSCHTEATA
jgi:hypothetical protein